MRRIVLFFIIIAAISFAGCGFGRQISPREAVENMCRCEAGLPAGQTYSLSACEIEPGYADPELLFDIYGFPEDFSGIEDAAFFLSEFRHPCEFAVFLCDSRDTAEGAALFLRERVGLLSRSARESAKLCSLDETEYRQYLDGAEVFISGRCAVLIISSDVKAAKRAFFGT